MSRIVFVRDKAVSSIKESGRGRDPFDCTNAFPSAANLILHEIRLENVCFQIYLREVE